MKVNLYIEINFQGRLNAGRGSYGVVLECTGGAGNPVTREHYGAVEDTTKNRLLICALICGLSHITKPCNISVYVNSNYITETITQERLTMWAKGGWVVRSEKVKNSDLWIAVLKLLSNHEISAETTREHPYTLYLKNKLTKIEVEFTKDIREESG